MFEEIFEKIRARLDYLYEKREFALKLSRDMLKYLRESMRLAHNKQLKESIAQLNKAKFVMDKIKEVCKAEPRITYSGFWLDVSKEYAETAIFLWILKRCYLNKDESLPTPEKLEVSDEAWILGLCEVVGELKREILTLARRHEFEQAFIFLNIVDEIYMLVSQLSYPSSIIPNLKARIDYVRAILVSAEELLIKLHNEYELTIKLDALRREKEIRK